MASHTIRVGIAGYGNLGRGALAALARCPDMRLAGVFTRRDPASLRLPDPATPVLPLDEAEAHRDDIDVMILCGGSKDDLPAQGPELARSFTTVDSYDTHARIPRYFEAIDAAARAHDNLSIIAVGWDPGLFSINRLMGEAILPAGATYTFWGKGLSQGHSDAIRRVPGVRAGVQYTIPVPEAVARVRAGEQPSLSPREKHRRECLVVLEPGADARAVEQAIVTMPDYFADYDTTVRFIDEATLAREHAGTAARRLRHPQRPDGQRRAPDNGIFPETGQQPRVHIQCTGGLRARRLADEGRRGNRRPHRLRCGTRPAVAPVPRGPARGASVRPTAGTPRFPACLPLAIAHTTMPKTSFRSQP